MDTKTKANNSGTRNQPGNQQDGDRQRQLGRSNNIPNTRGTTTSSQFQGQDQTEMKGIVINHSLDHKTPISQQFDIFYKAAKIAAGKMNPDLRKPMRTLKGLTEEDFTIAFPDAEKWTDNGVIDTHKKDLYSRLWIEEQKGIKKRIKRYKEDLKKMFDIMHGQLSSGITKKLKAKEDWTATEEQANTLKLLEYLKEICYRDDEFSICPPVDVLMKLKKFLTAFQDGSKDPTKYMEEMQMWFKIVSKELIRYTMKRVFPTKKYGNYSAMSDADKTPIIKAAEQILISVQIIKGSNRKNHRNLQGTLKDKYCLKKDAYPVNTFETLDMLLQFKTAKNNNLKQTSNNPNNSNSSKAARTEGNSKQGSEKTYKGTAFVTNGEASKGVVKEAHQLLMNGIAEGETFGEALCFMQISNMELMTQGSYTDEDKLLSDDEVPMLVARQTNWESDSESSTTEVTSTGHYGSDDEWSIDESPADWSGQSNSTQSQNRRGHEKPRSENCRSEDHNRSEKPRSEDDASQTTDTVSPDTEFLLTQNHGKLDPDLLLLDSKASCNVIINKALLRSIKPHPDNGRIVIHCNAGSVATTMVGDFPGFEMIWYLDGGIANILSLGLVSDKYCVTLDTSISQSFYVHKDDGTTRRFDRASNNLYTCNLTSQDETIFAIATEEGKKEFYSNNDIKRAEKA
eukprot:jgi/Psemu1/31192/gm1.31192_g